MRVWLKEYREINNMNQEDLAKVVGVSRQLIGLLESGKARPSVQVAQKIAIVFGFNWTIFFDEKQDEVSEEAEVIKHA